MCIHVYKHGVHSGQLEAAILELNERRLVISFARGLRTRRARTAHAVKTCGGVCGGMSEGGGCLRFDFVCCVYRMEKAWNLIFATWESNQLFYWLCIFLNCYSESTKQEWQKLCIKDLCHECCVIISCPGPFFPPLPRWRTNRDKRSSNLFRISVPWQFTQAKSLSNGTQGQLYRRSQCPRRLSKKPLVSIK